MNAHPHLDELIEQMRVVELDANNEELDALVVAYRNRFGLGPRERINERAEIWRGVTVDDRIVAVFGEKHTGTCLEVTDAYHDGTKAGLAAFMQVARGYYALLQQGNIDRLVHSILFANKDHWSAVIRETGDYPTVLVFIHERKGGT